MGKQSSKVVQVTPVFGTIYESSLWSDCPSLINAVLREIKTQKGAKNCLLGSTK